MLTLRAVLAILAIVGAPALLGGAMLGAQEVLLTPEQGLREIFPEVTRTSQERRALSAEARRRLEQQLGRSIDEDTVVVTLVYGPAPDSALRGYAVVTEEIGKYRPITFMVGVTPQFTVRDVAVLVYRESRGGEIRRRRFLSQYRGKGVRDPIDLNRDIINVSGATLSVRSMNAGVKRVLAEVSALYGPGAVPAR